jgi:hypothetical protein
MRAHWGQITDDDAFRASPGPQSAGVWPQSAGVWPQSAGLGTAVPAGGDFDPTFVEVRIETGIREGC